jgi:hypothetical protein
LAIDFHNYLGIEIDPDDGTGRVSVGNRLAERPSAFQHPSGIPFETLPDFALRHLMLADVRFEL